MEFIDLERVPATNGYSFVRLKVIHRDTTITVGLLGRQQREEVIVHLKEAIEYLED